MAKKRKTVTMLVTVSVPARASFYYHERAVTAADARREVRTLIADQTNYFLDPEDVKVRAVRPVPSANRRRGG